MAIIATFSEDHPNHGQIIDWSREVWVAGKQYEDPALAFVLCDIEEGYRPVSIDSCGAVSTVELNGIECPRCYESATVTVEAVEAE